MKRRLLLIVTLGWPATATAQTASPAPSSSSAPSSTPPVEAAPAPSAPQEKEVAEVRVIGDKADSLQKVPGSGQIISSKEIKNAEPYDTAELLNRVPGVTARQELFGGTRLDIGVRGLDPGRARSLLVLEDGIPMSINPYAEPDLYIAPQIERMRGIEVVKGSGSVLFGPSTIGGVINFLTIAPPTRQTAVVETDYGSFNYRRVLARYGDTFGSARYVAQASYKAGDGIEGVPFQTTDMFTKVAVDTSKTGQATLKLSFHDDSTYASDIGLTSEMFQQDPGQNALGAYNFLHQRRYEASLIDEEHIGDSTTIRTLVYAYETPYHWRRQDWELTPYDPDNPPAGTPSGFQRFSGDFSVPGSGVYFLNGDTILDRTYDVAGIEPRFESHFATGSVGHKLEYGARFLGESAEYRQSNGAYYNSDSGTLEEQEKHTTLAEAGYLQDTIAFRDDLLVTPGLRVEHADFHRVVLHQPGPQSSTNQCPPGQTTCPTDVNLAGALSSTGVIPGVGMIYGSRLNHVFGGIHLGWQPPRVASSFNPYGAAEPLGAQQAITYEVGTRVAPAPWARGEVTGFLISYNNEVINGTPSAAGIPTLTNGGPTRHIGFEAAATAGIGHALHWKTAVDLIARYSLARATFIEGPNGGNFVPYAPLNTFSAVLDVNHPSGFGGEVAFYFTDSEFADPNNTRTPDATGGYGLIPAHTNLDANIHYKHAPTGLSVRLVVKNALQDYYITERQPNGIAVGGFRQIMLGVGWNWEAKPTVD